MPFSHDEVVAVLDALDAPVNELTALERLRVSEQLEDVRRRLAVARHQELAELMAQPYGVPAMVSCESRPFARHGRNDGNSQVIAIS